MKKRKTIPLFAATSILLLSFSSLVSSAAETDDTQFVFSNDYLSCTVEQNSESLEYLRFGLDTKLGNIKNDSDNNRSLLYKNFFTGYTSVSITGNTYVYGTGKDIIEPFYDNNNTHISSQSFNNIDVKQELKFDKGMTELYDDMLKITYTITNNGEDTQTGLRIMLDPMLVDDDACVLKIKGTKITNESYFNTDIPKAWTIESNNYTEMQAFGILSDDCLPDKLVYADWEKLYDNRWDYDIRVNNAVRDAAVACYWEPKLLKSGESMTCTIFYGVKNAIKTEESDSEASQEESKPESSISDDSSSIKDDRNSYISPDKDAETANTGYESPICIIAIAAVLSLTVIIFAGRREKHEA